MRLQILSAAAAATLALSAPAGVGAADSSPMTITPAAAASAAAAGNAGAAANTGTPKTGERAANGKTGLDALARGDRRFFQKAAQGGMLEVELGKLAESKAAAPSVKSFGQRMVEDHGKANADLKAVADTLGVPMPQQLDKKHQQEIEKLSKLSGADFDRRYMQSMVTHHKRDVNDFEKASKSLKNPELKGFATDKVPVLKEHLKLAQTTEKEVRAAKVSN